MAQKKLSKTRQKIHQIYEENELANLESNKYRARSLTIGSANGGIIEVGMRGDYGHLWFLLQPVEAVEVIGQIASAAGIEIAMRPKQDFSAWRSWDTSLPNSSYWVGSAPWQLPEEEKNKLEAAKVQNIKAVNTIEDSTNEHQ